jgi:membrane protease YdiL (CAAX protease family)
MILLGLSFVFLGQAVFMLPGMTLLSILSMSEGGVSVSLDMTNMSPWMVLFTQGAGTAGGIAATLIAYRTFNKKQPNQLGIQGPASDLYFGLLLGAAAITLMFFILLLTGNITLLNGLSDPIISVHLIVFLILFILVGFFEEMFFRGYVMNTLASRGNQKWVIYVVSAVIFGLVHLTNPNVSFFGIVNIMLVGVLFAYMFDSTKSLLLPIGFHITWNYFQGTVFGFPVSGTTPYGMYAVDVSNGSAFLTGGTFGLEGGALATVFILLCFGATYIYTRNRDFKS